MTLAGKRVLVTGGSGFIGSHLCRRLVDEGAEVFVSVKYNSVIDNVRLVRLWDRITPVEADLRNPDSAAMLAEIEPHLVYHLAAYNHVGDSFAQVSESAPRVCTAIGSSKESASSTCAANTRRWTSRGAKS